MLNVILLFMGMMNDLSGTVLSARLLWPIASTAGVGPYHFAAITGVNFGLCTVPPPISPMLFLSESLSESVHKTSTRCLNHSACSQIWL